MEVAEKTNIKQMQNLSIEWNIKWLDCPKMPNVCLWQQNWSVHATFVRMYLDTENSEFDL